MAEVLYRKWRPRALDEVVGQETVTNTLKNAVSSGRLTHAYLFCGPRGTGKTSTARILARAVNCLNPVNGEPDNTCDRCLAIIEGRALDLIEIDAASNRGIDDIRELSDKIGFAPTESQYKVYIVDEVHMLTDPAFNALLKTLEEPPAHAIFILATTEVHKVPLTIVSRCQRYDFRRIPVGSIQDKLAQLSAAEGVQAEPEALDLLARHSTGSLRDAENLLEQAVVSYGSPLTGDQVRDMLELAGDDDALDLCQLVVQRNLSDGLALIGRIADQGSDLRQLQRAATEFLRAVMLILAGAGDPSRYSDTTAQRLAQIAAGADQSLVLRALRAFAEADIRNDSASSLPLELALAESALEPVGQPATGAAPAPPPPAAPQTARGGRQAPSAGQSRAPSYAPPRQPATPPSGRPPARQPRPAANRAPGQPLPTNPRERLDAVWDDLTRKALRNVGSRFKLGALLRSVREYDLEETRVVVKFAHKSNFDRFQEEMDNPAVKKQLDDFVKRAMGGDYELNAELESSVNGAGRRQNNQSHLVRAAQQMGARLIETVEEDATQ